MTPEDVGFNAKYFLSDPGKPGVRSMGPDVCHSKTLTDAILADEDTNSILTGNANRATQVTQQTMQVAPSDDQMLNQFKLCHLVDKYGTYTSGTIC